MAMASFKKEKKLTLILADEEAGKEVFYPEISPSVSDIYSDPVSLINKPGDLVQIGIR